MLQLCLALAIIFFLAYWCQYRMTQTILPAAASLITQPWNTRFALQSEAPFCKLYSITVCFTVLNFFFFFFSFSWALLSPFFNVAKEQHPMVSKATTVQIEHEGQEISLYLSSKHTGYDFCEKRSNRSQEKKPYLYILQSFCGKCLPT